jgi:hypothetical protein
MSTSTTLSCCLGLLLTLGVSGRPQQDPNRQLIPGQDFILEPFDTYGHLAWQDEMFRLDSFAIALEQNPRLIGYIIIYASKLACESEAQRRGVRAKNYLVGVRHIAWNRVIWKDVGYLEKPYVMLYGQIRGAEPYPFDHPKPLALTEVKVKKCSSKSRRYRRGTI